MIFHLFQHLKIHNSACLVDGLKETNPDAIKQHNWHLNRIRYFKKKKKKDFEGKSKSEIQRKITLNAHKIWILLQPNQFEYKTTPKKKKISVINRNNFFNYIPHWNQSRSQQYERPTTLIHTNKQKDKCPSILASI